MSTEKSQKIPNNYVCDFCHYKTCNKKDYNKHLSTLKHKNQQKSTKINDFIPKNPNCTNYSCNKCGKYYKDRSGLWRHNKKCINLDNSEIFNENSHLMKYLFNQNNQLQQQIIELCKNSITNTNNSNNNVNSHNKTFNLQLFLNETCKNAMNITDFVNSIQLQLTDLEKVGELGYVEGISKIIINNLKSLDITERPVHCSDMKRDVLYIKDNDKWEKEENENPKIKKAIKSIANKNISLIPEWKQKYPDCSNSNSTKSDIINRIIIESMETDKEKTDKIVKKIAREVAIDKEEYSDII